MSYGFMGNVLFVDLETKTYEIESYGENFYRKYMGGLGLGAYFLLKHVKPGIDPLGPDNVLVFAPGLLTGSKAPAVPRYTVCAKSPLTGAFGKSEAGGFFGPELKKAGFDALIVKGKAKNPVYINIDNNQIEIKDASKLWGKDTLETEKVIKNNEEEKVKIASIGPGAENQVLFSNIANELAHFNGRNGMGAVMGSKNLKAVVVKGDNEVGCYDYDTPKEITRWVAKNMKDHPLAYGLYKNGTAGGITAVNAGGTLPTNNWQDSVFENAEKIGAESLENILIKRKGCYSCPIRCKRVVELDREDYDYKIDPALGGPEYETLVCLGSNLGIDDIELISKANELCNRYTLDTMSLGMTISFAMECYEKGLITKEDTDGYELTFGNKEILFDLIEKTANKEGFGKKLALGSKKLAEDIGNNAEDFLLEVKGQELPAHDPRAKAGLGLQYVISSHGADHWVAQHDPFYQEKDSLGLNSVKPIGINEPVPADELSERKAKIVYYTHMLTMMYDCLGICVFGYISRSIVSLPQLYKVFSAVTGWDSSYFELMKAGERASVMMKVFNQREGFTKKDDKLPKRLFETISSGPLKDKNKVEENEFEKALTSYYKMAGLDDDGAPTKAKLNELSLEQFDEGGQ
ncbi:aldehyde ferredoxin oxidoreductase family protein [Natranaerofaba carboxydovora]|uniref:aldehyde ferredoxin oxidoreductase family protein n=1 Tax=Natranaerofaba carboxydovora TaxID=2742683 RepID=UPI001F137195|nr:aldehyde ferredoxin oxidoreductase family protein [Natranaerofaba carboxydovora]UMZ73636.1 putative oxidoreductase YdhV [Natranaerofaba carboxydovora]